MGGGSWSSDNYASRTRSKMASHGTSFVHDASIKSGAIPVGAHSTMDPKSVAGTASPFAGAVMRESCDSDEHPETLPIAVFFDVTGSMGRLPQILQTKLGKLYGLLLGKGYVEHPQILYGAVGDVYSDRVPLQVGQFESDDRADENLEDFYLEGNGGGSMAESYNLAAYFVAKHTHCDAFEKRGQKGYLFFIGDERVYPTLDRKAVEKFIGDKLEADMNTREIFELLDEKWNVYFLYASQGSYSEKEIIGDFDPVAGDIRWRSLLGQRAIVLDDVDAVCETIALTIGIQEGSIDLPTGIDHLRETGTDTKEIESASRALATVGAGVATSKGDASGDLDLGADDGAERI